MSDISVEEQPTLEEAKPRASRKRATKASETSEVSVAGAAPSQASDASAVSDATAAPEEKPKRKRGRPRKNPLPEEATQAAPAASEAAEADSSRTATKKRATTCTSRATKKADASSEALPVEAGEPKAAAAAGTVRASAAASPVAEAEVAHREPKAGKTADKDASAEKAVSAGQDHAGQDAHEGSEAHQEGRHTHDEGSADQGDRTGRDSGDEHDTHEGREGHDGADRGDDGRAYQRAGQKGQRKQRNLQQKNQGKNSYQKNSQQQKGGNNHYRNRRQHQQNRREPIVPQTSRDDLAKLKVAELRVKAEELGVEFKGLKKAELVDAVFDASVKAEGFIEVEGILDILSDGYGFLRTNGYLPSEHDVYVGLATIRRNGLRKGDVVSGQIRPARPNEKYAALQRVDTINGKPIDEIGKRVRFADLTPVFPDERLLLEHGKSTITARVIDLCAPIGKGQRGLIVSPPKAGKTTILKDIAASITANNPEVHLMCLLVDERPEEVTDMERSIRGEVISSTFDMPSENHIAVAEMVIERAKRLVEDGGDVVILLDSLTRLARAYNLATPASGRILSGGVDSTALYPPKKFLGAARNIEGGGSLTILASALIETGSKMDEVIFEEFKGTGNMEVKLDRTLADRRIFPAIDPIASGTRREDLLLDPQEAPLIWAVRRVLANRNNIERATESLIKSLQQTNNNQEFLLRAAKKAQGHHFEEGNIEL